MKSNSYLEQTFIGFCSRQEKLLLRVQAGVEYVEFEWRPLRIGLLLFGAAIEFRVRLFPLQMNFVCFQHRTVPFFLCSDLSLRAIAIGVTAAMLQANEVDNIATGYPFLFLLLYIVLIYFILNECEFRSFFHRLTRFVTHQCRQKPNTKHAIHIRTEIKPPGCHWSVLPGFTKICIKSLVFHVSVTLRGINDLCWR